MTSVAFESLGAPLELRLVDLEEEVVEGGSVDEIVADQSGEKREERRAQTGMMRAKRRNREQLSPENKIHTVEEDGIYIEMLRLLTAISTTNTARK